MGNLVASLAHSGGVVLPLFETAPSTKFIEAWSPWIDEDEDKKKRQTRERKRNKRTKWNKRRQQQTRFTFSWTIYERGGRPRPVPPIPSLTWCIFGDFLSDSLSLSLKRTSLYPRLACSTRRFSSSFIPLIGFQAFLISNWRLSIVSERSGSWKNQRSTKTKQQQKIYR